MPILDVKNLSAIDDLQEFKVFMRIKKILELKDWDSLKNPKALDERLRLLGPGSLKNLPDEIYQLSQEAPLSFNSFTVSFEEFKKFFNVLTRPTRGSQDLSKELQEFSERILKSKEFQDLVGKHQDLVHKLCQKVIDELKTKITTNSSNDLEVIDEIKAIFKQLDFKQASELVDSLSEEDLGEFIKKFGASGVTSASPTVASASPTVTSASPTVTSASPTVTSASPTGSQNKKKPEKSLFETLMLEKRFNMTLKKFGFDNAFESKTTNRIFFATEASVNALRTVLDEIKKQYPEYPQKPEPTELLKYFRGKDIKTIFNIKPGEKVPEDKMKILNDLELGWGLLQAVEKYEDSIFFVVCDETLQNTLPKLEQDATLVFDGHGGQKHVTFGTKRYTVGALPALIGTCLDHDQDKRIKHLLLQSCSSGELQNGLFPSRSSQQAPALAERKDFFAFSKPNTKEKSEAFRAELEALKKPLASSEPKQVYKETLKAIAGLFPETKSDPDALKLGLGVALDALLDIIKQKAKDKESRFIITLPDEQLNIDSILKPGLARTALETIYAKGRQDIALSFSENLINPSLVFGEGNVGRQKRTPTSEPSTAATSEPSTAATSEPSTAATSEPSTAATPAQTTESSGWLGNTTEDSKRVTICQWDHKKVSKLISLLATRFDSPSNDLSTPTPTGP